jgi:myo-inositol 2-dehydrogenase/D-chiro-inositol 1-dehydrogenase
MRLGLLGLGRIGAFHAQTLSGLPEVEELVVSDPVAELTADVAGRLGARAASSPEEVLAAGSTAWSSPPPPTRTHS